MSKLEKRLEEWVALGFMSPDQAQRIRDHEAKRPESSWIVSGILLLGTLIIGIGVISLIASNWKHIPDLVKLAGNFSILLAIAYSTVRAWESKKLIRFEVLLLLFVILCLASLGLISQIFHTAGKLHQALLFWSLITAAAALAARQVFIPFIWAGAFLTGIVFSALDSLVLRQVFQKHSQAIFMALPLLCACLTVLSKRWAEELGPTRAFRAWTIICGLAALIVAELPFARKGMAADWLIAYSPSYLLSAATVVGILRTPAYRPIQKTLLLLTLVAFLNLFHLPLLNVYASLHYAAITILILTLMSLFSASLNQRRLFQQLLSLIGLRFLILYFQALGGLAATGVGLIVSGCFVIGLAYLWNRYRKDLAIWTERWVQ